MRDIKFRAWHKNVKSMCYDITTDLLNKNYLEFMQYTGIKDINGVDIYEGDLLEDNENQLWEVIFDKGCFIVTNVFIPGNRFIADDLIIVGNIHKNRELIEEGKKNEKNV